MDEIFHWIRGHIHGEWSTVTGAPMLFTMAVFLVGLVMFFGMRAHFGERIAAHKANIDHKDSLLAEYRDRLKGATPVEVQQKIVALEDTVARLSKIVNRPQRRLSDEQAGKLKEAVDRFKEEHNRPGSHMILPLNIFSTPDTEASRFCKHLADTFEGLGVSCSMNTLGMHEEGEGEITFYCSDFDHEYWFSYLADTFEKVGLKIERRADPLGQTYIFIAPQDL